MSMRCAIRIVYHLGVCVGFCPYDGGCYYACESNRLDEQIDSHLPPAALIAARRIDLALGAIRTSEGSDGTSDKGGRQRERERESGESNVDGWRGSGKTHILHLCCPSFYLDLMVGSTPVVTIHMANARAKRPSQIVKDCVYWGKPTRTRRSKRQASGPTYEIRLLFYRVICVVYVIYFFSDPRGCLMFSSHRCANADETRHHEVHTREYDQPIRLAEVDASEEATEEEEECRHADAHTVTQVRHVVG